jgi:signal transduction histidine kinase
MGFIKWDMKADGMPDSIRKPVVALEPEPALARAEGAESSLPTNDRLAEHLAFFSLLPWTLLVGVIWGLTLYNEQREEIEFAYSEARAAFHKDVVYRYWASEQGGVYVPVSDKVPPNPYLTNISDRDVITTRGRHLTLVNPAYMTRMVHELGFKEFGLRAHITSLNPIRPENAADAWETNALRKLARGQAEVREVVSLDGTNHLRFMAPLLVQDRCLKCHAPQGYKLGDLRGGISVAVPMNESGIIACQHHTRVFLMGLGVLWLLGIVGIGRGGLLLRTRRFELEHAFQELAHKNRELQNVLYASSHDLRSPLLNIQGFSQRVEKACADLKHLLDQPSVSESTRLSVRPLVGDQIPSALRFIRTSVEKMDILIGGMLRLSRLGQVTLRPERLDMNHLLDQVVATLAIQIQSAGAELNIGTLPACTGDAQLLSQVFSNLLDNALKYRHPERPLRLEVTGHVEGGQCIYCVADNGVGIAPKHLESIWELFRRLNPSGPPGEGLGLNLARRILERHRGRIWVESTPGQGSRFMMSIPLAL